MSSFYQQPGSKWLHRLALNSVSLKKAAFDLDTRQSKRVNVSISRPIYITGLARAGSTLMLNILSQSPELASLTYRDMPFVMAPGIWKKLSQRFQISGSQTERAHRDGININYDSSEALEEVFWLTFLGEKYIQKNYLSKHHIDEDTAENYNTYIKNVLTSRLMNSERKSLRYLAKNNNHLLRLQSLVELIPDVYILIMFRNPIDHAMSLLRQHKNFIQQQSNDKFVLNYMNWLGHFEFGSNFKPFCFEEEPINLRFEDTHNFLFWLKYWNTIYKNTLRIITPNCLFFDYDHFCRHPHETLKNLCQWLQLPEGPLQHTIADVRTPTEYEDFKSVEVPKELLSQANGIYEELKKRFFIAPVSY